MPKFYHLLLCVIGVLFTSQSYSGEKVNYYVIANQAQPFQIERNGEQHSGIVSDIVAEIFTDSRYDLVYHTYPFNRMISILEAGGTENWITYGSPKWGKVQSENLSDLPIYTVRHAIVTSQITPFIYQDISSLGSKGMVLLLGFDYPELMPYIKQGKMEEIRVKDYQAAFSILKRLPEDTVFVEMESRVKYHLGRLGLPRYEYRIDGFSDVIPDYPIHLAFSSSIDPAIQKFINRRLAEIAEDGTLEEIVNRYI
ncbi:substrate-binding periplasmic protein [Vibrio sp. VPAP30]|uniref:substrate-binding periplasmic protein n=1 Tax=Vibrio sp. VPAP30 TaxID=1647102 RepID=UPI0006590CB8|nr:ABC transporter substrate-binding protein [Vibrio sp. VPAP30]KLN63458.1 amino acid ABC transporter [Vibrio sp. VPAP30]